MNIKKSFYLTSTLPYVNAPLHMGHALELIRADTIARYKKLQGFDVYFNTGTDEHGVKIYDKATSSGISAQDFVDQGFETFKEQLRMFNLCEDIHFIRTTDEKHIKIAQDFWRKVKENGYIYKKNYKTKYCSGCESEKTDSELVNGECPEHLGFPLKLIEEDNYFFKYSLFGEKLLKLYEEPVSTGQGGNINFIVPEFRFNEIKNFVKSGLQDFSISRQKEKMPWGIEVPGDNSQVMYVWFDALVNYISTLADKDISTVDELIESDIFKKYWINGTPTQYCGKDNTRFQGAMWQAMLMAAGLPNSHQIIVNGFITGEGGIRMSKTLGNVVDPRDIVNEYGTDALRYFLLREVSSFEDGPFTVERFKDAYNSGLANGLGNLTSRILTMSSNYGVRLSDQELNMKYYEETKEDLENFDINKFLNWIWECLGALDKYIQKNEPFKKIKINKEEALKDVHYLLLHLYKASLAIEPMLPETSIKIQELIKQNKKPDQPLFVRK
jgi:methionyl-tRNA synthetase